MSVRSLYTGDTVELHPDVSSSEDFTGVKFIEDDYYEDNCWVVQFFEGKTNRIRFSKFQDEGDIPDLTSITLRPAPTMTFLNPRPAPGIVGYPWSYNADPNSHIIKLPLALTYSELMEGAQIIVSGVTESLAVIQGTTEGNLLVFRAGGLLVAYVSNYEGTSDLVRLQIREDFTGEVHAVNFDKAYKNLPGEISIDGTYDYIVSYNDSDGIIAKCTLNGVVISERPNYIPSNGLLGNLVFQSKYLQAYGDVIESYYWTNGRYLYILRLNDSYKMTAINMQSTNSPLLFPII